MPILIGAALIALEVYGIVSVATRENVSPSRVRKKTKRKPATKKKRGLVRI